MKLLSSLFITFLLLGSLFGCQQLPAGTNPELAAVTTIYVVRHGEKVTADSTDKDPALNAEGVARAEELRSLLKDKPVHALYTTNYKRTMGTLKPLADERQLELLVYESNNFESLKTQVLQNYTGKTVVISGHSNTILEIVEAFGTERPVAAVPDSKYDHIFKITIGADGTAILEAGQYGKATS